MSYRMQITRSFGRWPALTFKDHVNLSYVVYSKSLTSNEGWSDAIAAKWLSLNLRKCKRAIRHDFCATATNQQNCFMSSDCSSPALHRREVSDQTENNIEIRTVFPVYFLMHPGLLDCWDSIFGWSPSSVAIYHPAEMLRPVSRRMLSKWLPESDHLSKDHMVGEYPTSHKIQQCPKTRLVRIYRVAPSLHIYVSRRKSQLYSGTHCVSPIWSW